MASSRYSRERSSRNWMSAAKSSAPGGRWRLFGRRPVQRCRLQGLLRSCWLCPSVVAGFWPAARGSRNPVGLWPDTFHLPSAAGEVPAPMAGAQRRHKVQAHPAPAFLTKIESHILKRFWQPAARQYQSAWDQRCPRKRGQRSPWAGPANAGFDARTGAVDRSYAAALAPAQIREQDQSAAPAALAGERGTAKWAGEETPFAEGFNQVSMLWPFLVPIALGYRSDTN
jgi:hypothetical protein